MSFQGHNKDSSWGMVLQPNVEVVTFRSIWEERSRFTSLNRRLSRWFGESRGIFSVSLLKCIMLSSMFLESLMLNLMQSFELDHLPGVPMVWSCLYLRLVVFKTKLLCQLVTGLYGGLWVNSTICTTEVLSSVHWNHLNFYCSVFMVLPNV